MLVDLDPVVLTRSLYRDNKIPGYLMPCLPTLLSRSVMHLLVELNECGTLAILLGDEALH